GARAMATGTATKMVSEARGLTQGLEGVWRRGGGRWRGVAGRVDPPPLRRSARVRRAQRGGLLLQSFGAFAGPIVLAVGGRLGDVRRQAQRGLGPTDIRQCGPIGPGGASAGASSSASAFAAYSLAMMMSRLDTSPSEEINERRRQMSACRRKYAALGMAARPQVFSATPEPRCGSRRTALEVVLF